ncbi:MAG: hypothetical protein ACUVRZ_02135 [Desulfobacca sp.]
MAPQFLAISADKLASHQINNTGDVFAMNQRQRLEGTKPRQTITGSLTLLTWWLLAVSAAGAEVYLEGYAGYVKTATVFRQYLVMTTHHPALGTFEEHHTRGTYLPGLIAGVKVGTWFVPDGFLGAAYPDWLRHFGVYLDFNYHRQNFRQRECNTLLNGGVDNTRNIFESNGNAFTLALMFAARLGFLADEAVPFGRLQPYFAVGPALLITEQKVVLKSRTLTPGGLEPYALAPDWETAVVPALAVEPGLRWFFQKNFALDLSFKFRWAHPSFTFSYLDPFSAVRETFTLYPQYLILSIQLGIAYHF